MKLLLGAGADPRQPDGQNALAVAVSAGNKELIDLLLAAGAEIDAWHVESTALNCAVARGRLDIVRHLLSRGAKCSIDDGTALAAAAKRGDSAMIDLLLAAGASLDRHGDKALQEAIYALREEAVAFLLRRGAKPGRGAVEAARQWHTKKLQEAQYVRQHRAEILQPEFAKATIAEAAIAERILRLIEGAALDPAVFPP